MKKRSLWALVVAAVAATLLVAVVGTAPASAAASATSVAPNTLGQGAAGVTFVVNGSGFSATGGAPSVTVSGTGVTVTNVVITNANKLTGTINVASNAATGQRNVTVNQGPGGLDSSTCTNCLTITTGPSITGNPSPTAYSNNGSPASTTVTVNGSNFVNGAQLKLQRATGDFPDIVASGVNVANGGTKISGTVNFAGQPAGKWKVVVVNPDKGQAAFGDGVTTGFTIGGGQPTLTTVTPSARGQGTAAQLTLDGSNFARGATVSMSPNVGGEITISNPPTWVNNGKVQVNVSLSPTATPGPRNVTFTNFDSQTVTCNACFTITAKPTITSIVPPAKGQGASNKTIVIHGTGFAATPAVAFGGTGVSVHGSVQFDNSTQLTVNIDVAPGASTGARGIVVTNPDGGFASSTFTINGAPAITSATPASRGQNASNQNVVLTGSNFQSGPPAPVVTVSGTGVTVNTVTFNDPQHLTLNVTVAANATLGARNVTVTNPDDGVGTGNGVFTVNAGPTITSLTPNAQGRNTFHKSVVVTGGGFVATPTVEILNGSSPDPNITVHSVVVNDANHLTLDVTVGNAAVTGPHNVRVTNPDAGNTTASNAFTVTDPPTIDHLTPASLGQGASQTVHITGTGFSGTPTVTFSGTGVVASNVQRNSDTDLQLTVTVDPNATASARDVTVTNPDFGNATKAGGFTVTAGPHITSITPGAAANTGSVNITNLAGSGFANNAVVQLERNGFDPVPMNGETVTNNNKITGSFALNTAGHGGVPVAPGAWTVRVTNPSDNGTATLTDGFTVTGSAPTLTGTYALSQGASATLHLTGTNFADGAAVAFSGTGVTAGTVTVVSSTQIDVATSVAANAATGPRDITITNADGSSGGCTGCLTISAKPTITSIVPNTVGQGAAHKSVQINGSNFDASPGVQISGAGITVHSVTRNSAALLTLDLSVDAAAPATARDVTVTNGDGGSVTSTGGLTITAKPFVSNLSPNSLQQGASHRSVQVNGGNFDSAPTVSFSGTGITVHSVTRNSAVLLTLDVSIDAAATLGSRDATVTNSDGGTSTASSVFTVKSNPIATSLSPNNLKQGASHQSVQVNGSGFDATPGVAFSGTGITVHSVTRNSAVLLTLDVSIDPAATLGARNVTVTNSDSGTNTTNSAFTVKSNPSVTSLSPNSRGQGASHISVQVNGSGFDATPGVAFSATGVTVHSVTRNSAVLLTLDLSIDPAAAIGNRDVTVTNSDGSASTLVAGFTVTTKPTTTSATPNSLVQGATGNVVLAGANYVATPTVSFSGTGITVNNVTRDSANQLTVNVTVAANAAAGARDVTVRNPDQGASTATAIFTVTSSTNSLSPFQQIGGPIIGNPALASPSANVAIAVTTASDTQVQARVLSNGTWGAPVNLNGQSSDGPGVTARAGLAEVFVQGTDHSLYTTTCNLSTGCTGWTNLGGVIQGQPAAVAWDSSRIDVFVRGTDNAMYHKFWINGTWSGYENMGGVLTASPAVTSVAPNRLTVAVRGTDGQIYVRTWNGSAWTNFTSVGGSAVDQPALTAQPGSKIDLWARSTDTKLYRSRNFGGFGQVGGGPVPGTAGVAAAYMATNNGDLILVATRGTDNNLYIGQGSFP